MDLAKWMASGKCITFMKRLLPSGPVGDVLYHDLEKLSERKHVGDEFLESSGNQVTNPLALEQVLQVLGWPRKQRLEML